MAAFLGLDTGIDLSSINQVVGTSLFYIILLLALVVVLGIIGYFLIMMKIYRFKVVDFENINGGRFEPVLKDSARLVKVGDGGETILWLRKRKEYRTAYGRKMGKNTYWFAQGQDGYYYNIVLGDLDAKMGMLDVEPVDRDVRMMHVANRKNYQSRYRKVSFMDKYGSYIMGGVLLIIMLIGSYYITTKQGTMVSDTNTATTRNLEISQLIQEKNLEVLIHLEEICSSSGLRPAT